MRYHHPQQLNFEYCDTFLHTHSSRPLLWNRRLALAIYSCNNSVWPLIHAVLIFIALSIFSVAQAQSPAQAIGQVETLRGTATATRGANSFGLKVGDPILSGDSVQTGQASTLGITFLDQTVFSLAANAKMVINDLVYNPQGSSNNMAIKLVQGTFVFLAGQIAPTGNMIIDTPVAQIGIRGTLPWITVGNTTSFAILSERDGKTGEYFLLQKSTGNVIGTVNLSTVGTRQKLVMNSPNDIPRTVDKTPEELAAEQRFRDQIFDTLNVRDTRLGIIVPDQGNQNPPPGDQGGNPPPGDQGSAPGSGPSNAALLDQANAIVAACTEAQTKINRALQYYYQGNNPQSQKLLLEARDNINRWPPQSCGNLLERVAGGLQAIGQALDDERRAHTAINSCNENEINRLRGQYASSRQSNAPTMLANLDAAARECANRRLQRERADAKSRANAWCRANKGRGYVAGRIRANGSFSCLLTRKERSRQAWAKCRRQYGRRLVDVKIYKSGRYRCIVPQRQARPQQPPQQPPQQQHNPTSSAAVIGGILGAIQGLGKKERPSYHNK